MHYDSNNTLAVPRASNPEVALDVKVTKCRS
jgi:hypothetical protein